mmetsp:Transcript_40726/g.92898  ORF Transcript_40726/g.92898 Transcript_40726/m.92898 type:complete len:254 (+) Transcript_40726:55-816(+)
MAAVLARDEHRHRLICRPSLLLVERAFALLALSALEHVRRRHQSLVGRDVHLVLEDCLVVVCLLLLNLGLSGHLVGSELWDAVRTDLTAAHLLAEIEVFRVLEVELDRLDLGGVLVISADKELPELLLDLSRELVRLILGSLENEGLGEKLPHPCSLLVVAGGRGGRALYGGYLFELRGRALGGLLGLLLLLDLDLLLSLLLRALGLALFVAVLLGRRPLAAVVRLHLRLPLGSHLPSDLRDPRVGVLAKRFD